MTPHAQRIPGLVVLAYVDQLIDHLIWPDLDLAGCRELTENVHESIRLLLVRLKQPDAPGLVEYTNTQGRTFTSSVTDILQHMMLHAMYHRGQVMLGVRELGGQPVSTDFIAFTRDR